MPVDVFPALLVVRRAGRVNGCPATPVPPAASGDVRLCLDLPNSDISVAFGEGTSKVPSSSIYRLASPFLERALTSTNALISACLLCQQCHLNAFPLLQTSCGLHGSFPSLLLSRALFQG